eukprot:COSAG01_NODE_8943_length_2607_cov_7.177033_2_plen_89_part_00
MAELVSETRHEILLLALVCVVTAVALVQWSYPAAFTHSAFEYTRFLSASYYPYYSILLVSQIDFFNLQGLPMSTVAACGPPAALIIVP